MSLCVSLILLHLYVKTIGQIWITFGMYVFVDDSQISEITQRLFFIPVFPWDWDEISKFQPLGLETLNEVRLFYIILIKYLQR